MTTLPGSLVSPVAGSILRPGAPVNGRIPFPDGVIGAQDGIVYGVSGPVCSVVCGFARVLPAMLEDISLDLSDDLGMDIAARWLARHHGLKVETVAPWWFHRGNNDHTFTWCLTLPYQRMLFFADAPTINPLDVAVPGIDAITSPAEALRLACLAAVEST